MELYLTREEILRQVRAMLGMQTTASLAGQVDTQHVLVVQAAALKVQQDCRWVNLQRHVDVELGIEEHTINYPSNVGPGGVLEMAVYSDDRYYPLESRIIPPQADTDVEEGIGGETYDRVLGRPKFYECRNQIHLWPPTDKAYHLRVNVLLRADLPTNASMSVVDAQLIIYKAAEMMSVQHGDKEQAAYYATLYQDRMMALRAWQSAGTRFAMNSEADLAEDEFFNQDLIPNWNRGVTSTPGAP
jgi:hypothetical protein